MKATGTDAGSSKGAAWGQDHGTDCPGQNQHPTLCHRKSHSLVGGPSPAFRGGLICQVLPRTAEQPCQWGHQLESYHHLSPGDCGTQAGPPGEE